MHPQTIRAELRIKGKTLRSLADEIGVSATTLSLVIDGRATSARVKEAVAKELGKPVSAIWPTSTTKTGLRRLRASAA